MNKVLMVLFSIVSILSRLGYVLVLVTEVSDNISPLECWALMITTIGANLDFSSLIMKYMFLSCDGGQPFRLAENPSRHGENKETAHRKAEVWHQNYNLLSERRQFITTNRDYIVSINYLSNRIKTKPFEQFKNTLL